MVVTFMFALGHTPHVVRERKTLLTYGSPTQTCWKCRSATTLIQKCESESPTKLWWSELCFNFKRQNPLASCTFNRPSPCCAPRVESEFENETSHQAESRTNKYLLRMLDSRVPNPKSESMQNEFISVFLGRSTLGKLETTPQIGEALEKVRANAILNY